MSAVHLLHCILVENIVFLLHYVHLTATVTSNFTDEVCIQKPQSEEK